MNPRGLTDVMCNFGSGGRVTSGFALCKRYVVCLFSFQSKGINKYCGILEIGYLQEL